MTPTQSLPHPPRNSTRFQIFKYVIYSLILINVAIFLVEDYQASLYTFTGGVTLTNVIGAFATFVDSMSWFILLIVFELQTFVISDEKLVGKLKWSLHFVIFISYIFIILAFFGYVEKAKFYYDFTPHPTPSACDTAGQIDAFALSIDVYEPLTPETCKKAGAAPYFHHTQTSILSSEAILIRIKRLAVTDVINSGVWLLIVLVLWVDIVLQISGKLSETFYRANVYIKTLLYTTLIAACGYWFWLREWVDGWDALLWIMAFFAIELNLFNWHEETHEQQAIDTENEARLL